MLVKLHHKIFPALYKLDFIEKYIDIRHFDIRKHLLICLYDLMKFVDLAIHNPFIVKTDPKHPSSVNPRI